MCLWTFLELCLQLRFCVTNLFSIKIRSYNLQTKFIPEVVLYQGVFKNLIKYEEISKIVILETWNLGLFSQCSQKNFKKSIWFYKPRVSSFTEICTQVSPMTSSSWGKSSLKKVLPKFKVCWNSLPCHICYVSWYMSTASKFMVIQAFSVNPGGKHCQKIP